ncbi:putative Strictosidine synthase [Quillaja saponaria]|uniref:Strictosidine synthase n=1 Tax=Quillaja saponaria TaxID=32244 RepID=A0AAD7Q8B7_QUISA|nr:putative Strictosidine synthase [Quillaja saponaria]
MGKLRIPASPMVGFTNGMETVRGGTEFVIITFHRKDCICPFAPELEYVCERPLEPRFDKKSGDLYNADAYLGLQVVGPPGG